MLQKIALSYDGKIFSELKILTEKSLFKKDAILFKQKLKSPLIINIYIAIHKNFPLEKVSC